MELIRIGIGGAVTATVAMLFWLSGADVLPSAFVAGIVGLAVTLRLDRL